MKTCNIGNTGDHLDTPQCLGPGSLRSSSEEEDCRVLPSTNEDVGLRDLRALENSNTRGGVLATLPGCNPIQAAPGDATQQSGCRATTQLNSSHLPAAVGRAPPPSPSSSSSTTKPSPTPSSSAASGSPKSLTPGWASQGALQTPSPPVPSAQAASNTGANTLLPQGVFPSVILSVEKMRGQNIGASVSPGMC